MPTCLPQLRHPVLTPRLQSTKLSAVQPSCQPSAATGKTDRNRVANLATLIWALVVTSDPARKILHIGFVARFAFTTSDTPADGFATAFLFGMVAAGAFAGPAIGRCRQEPRAQDGSGHLVGSGHARHSRKLDPHIERDRPSRRRPRRQQRQSQHRYGSRS